MFNLACHQTGFKNLKMNLDNLNLVELNHVEKIVIEGGGKVGTLIKIIKKAGHETADFFRGLYDGFTD